MAIYYAALLTLMLIVYTAHGTPANDDRTPIPKNSKGTSVCVGVCPEINVVKTDKCFSSDSWVYLTNGQRKTIGQLRTGDKMLASDGVKMITTEMIFMLDQNQYAQAKFYTITTESNHNISLTAEHLILVTSTAGTTEYVPAENVQVGRDSLSVLSNDGIIIQSRVIRVFKETKIGYFAPFVMSGTLLINNVTASCYSNVKSHRIAQIAMTPIKWYYRMTQHFPFIQNYENKQEQNGTVGIHWIPELMLNFAEGFYPSVLHFSSENSD